MKKKENKKKAIEDIAFGIRLGEWLDTTKKHCTKKEKIGYLKGLTGLCENTLDTMLDGKGTENTKECCVQAILEAEDKEFRKNISPEKMEEMIVERKAKMCRVDRYIYKAQFLKRWKDWDFRVGMLSFALGIYSMFCFMRNENIAMYALAVIFIYVSFATLKGSLWCKNLYNDSKPKGYGFIKCMAVMCGVGLLVYGMFPEVALII